jgi:nucleotide-binding universal stress UspA family protein
VSEFLECVMAGVRYFGVALDYSPSSKYALKWAIDNIFRADDVVILLFVNTESVDGDQSDLWGEEGSPLVPFEGLSEPNLQRHYQLKPDEEITQYAEEASTVKKVKVMAKFYWGDPKEKLVKAVVETPLDALVMGSRGYGTFARTLLGSVSNYVVNNVPCPVTIVKLPPSSDEAES